MDRICDSGPAHLQIQTEQNTSLEYGQIYFYTENGKKTKQIRRCAPYNQAASLLHPSSISAITHQQEVSAGEGEEFVTDVHRGQWELLAGVL